VVVDVREDTTESGEYVFDTLNALTYRGDKLMFRFSVDPKAVLPGDIFGENDLKLYGEVAVVGVRNFPNYFEHIEDRMPFVLGFNFPGFKFVDLINTEWEYCSNKWAYSPENVYSNSNSSKSVPKPISLFGMTQNPWRWSVYVKKTLCNGHFGIIAQAARDHMNIKRYYFEREDYGEALVLPDNWWWVLKTEFKF
jgi:hypothetical protein